MFFFLFLDPLCLGAINLREENSYICANTLPMPEIYTNSLLRTASVERGGISITFKVEVY